MTLVTLNVPIGGGPIITADLLVTSPVRSGAQARNLTPARSKHSGDRAGALYVYQMRQKLVMVTPHLMMGASGLLTDILRVLDHLRAVIGSKQVSLRQLEEIVVGSPIGAMKRIQFEAVGRFEDQVFNAGWNDLVISKNPEIRACGSGAKAYSKFLGEYSFSGWNLRDGQPNDTDRLLARAFMQSAKFLADEYFLGTPLKNQFGGYWQIGGYFDDQIKLIGDISFAFWRADKTPSGQLALSMQPFFVSSHYRNGFLVLQMIEAIGPLRSDAELQMRDNVFVMSGIDSHLSRRDAEAVERPNFSTTLLCSVLRIGGAIPPLYHITFRRNANKDHGIRVIVDSDKITLGFRGDVIAAMEDAIRKGIPTQGEGG